MLSTVRIPPVLPLLLAMLVSMCHGQTVVRLKSGKTFSGAIVDQSGNFLTLRVDGRDVKILRSIIASIDSSRQSAPAAGEPRPSPEPAKQPPAAPAQSPAEPASQEHVFKLQNGGVMRGVIVDDRGNFIRILVGGKPINILKTIIAEMDGKPFGEQASPAQASPAQASPEQASPAQASPARASPAQATPKQASPRQPPPTQADSRQTSPEQASDRQASAQPAHRQPKGPAAASDAQPARPAAVPDKPATVASVSRDSKPQVTERPPLPRPATPPATVRDTAPTPPRRPPDQPSGRRDSAGAPAEPRPAPLERESTAQSGQTQPSPGAPKAPPEEVAVPDAVPLVEPERMSTELGPLVNQLGSRDAMHQAVAAMRIARMGPAAAPATPYLIRNLRNTKHVRLSRDRKEGTTVARAAAQALVAIGDPSVGGLVRALAHTESAVRRHAAWALGELKNAAGIVPLMNATADEEDPVRAAVAEALGKIRDPRSIPLLVTTMNQDESPLVRRTAETALRKLTEIPLLIEGLKDGSPVVRNNSAYILWLMTAKEFRTDAAAWEQWWREQQGQAASGGSAAAEE